MFRKSLSVGLLMMCACAAQADVWKWVDANGDTHFVDTMKPIYTWLDSAGKVHYSDTPEDPDAIAVQLVWVSGGSLDDMSADDSVEDGSAYPGESAEQRAEREAAEAYYCKRATEVYESYVNAPQLYTTDASGERVYLSEEEAEQTTADARAKKDKYCK